MSVVWTPIAPGEVLFRGLNWAPRLGSDTIASSTWSASTPAGLTIVPYIPAFIGYNTLVTISGATIDVTYEATNTVITAAGQTEKETIQITCAKK